MPDRGNTAQERGADERASQEGDRALAIHKSADQALFELVSEMEIVIDRKGEELAQEEARKKRDDRIQRHYHDMAEKAMNALWKRCRKKTGHARVHRMERGESYYECEICHFTMSKDNASSFAAASAKVTNDRKIGYLAKKLREADRKANIEWQP